MTITIKSTCEKLHKEFSILGQVHTSRRGSAVSEVFSSFMIAAADGVATATATDGSSSGKITLTADLAGDGVFLVNAERLASVLTNARGEVTIEADLEDKKLTIRGVGFNIKIPTVAPDAFPDFRPGEGNRSFTISGKDLARIYEMTSYVFSGPRGGEDRPDPNVSIEHDGERLTMFATDGIRLAAAWAFCPSSTPFGGKGDRVVIPLRYARVAAAFFLEASEVKFKVSHKDIVGEVDGASYIFSHSAGMVPDWRNGIIAGKTRGGTVSKATILEMLSLVTTVKSDESKAVHISCEKSGVMTMTAASHLGSAEASGSVAWNHDQAGTGWFNGLHLRDIARKSLNDDFEIIIHGDKDPLIAKGVTWLAATTRMKLDNINK